MDALEGLKKLKDNSIDLIVTDPPYMISKEITIRRSRNPLKYKYIGKDIRFNFGEWDLFDTEKEYLEFTEKWFKECSRILKPSGHIVSFFDRWKIGELVKLGKKYGIEGRQALFWIKKNPVPCARKVAFMNAVEMAYWGTKLNGEKKTKATFNYKLGQHPEYLICPITPTKRDRKRHPCEKHPKWVEWVIEYLSNEEDLILDCFAGTGVVGEVALKLNRNFIGFEISEEYCKIAELRLKRQLEQTKRGGRHFSQSQNSGTLPNFS